MALKSIGGLAAFENLASNPFARWPSSDDAGNRFARFAAPAFSSGFRLVPGQRVFTIGSCFARAIEKALADRGFEVPTLAYDVDREGAMNIYAPTSMAPQIRWAFGLDAFEIDRHALEAAPDRYIDPHVAYHYMPASADQVLARRERIGAIYRQLADSQVIVITLGLIETWFDGKAGQYLNRPPLRSMAAAEPDRFELRVLGYDEVMRSLRDLIALLRQVCPADHRVILTVSPVPSEATFTDADVAVANCYSKSVLRAAAGAMVAEFEHLDYFPSYESVTLTSREIAFREDQIHVTPGLVKFNVDRLIGRYLDDSGPLLPADAIARAAESRRGGGAGAALSILQAAWADHPGDAELVVALAKEHFAHGHPPAGEKLLKDFLAETDDAAAHLALSRYYGEAGRHQEALAHGERGAVDAPRSLNRQLPRIAANYHLGRYAEGLALLESVRFVAIRLPTVLYWKARFNAQLGAEDIAEAQFRECAEISFEPSHLEACAEFLAARPEREDLGAVIARLLELDPSNAVGLRLRREVVGREAAGSQ